MWRASCDAVSRWPNITVEVVGMPRSVGCRDHLDPLLDVDPARGDLVPELLVQHFRGSARQAADSGGLQAFQVFPDGAP